jgi:hypothetical protein
VFDDVDKTIAKLVDAGLPADLAGRVSISFATPDDSFPPSTLTLPTVNFFLFQIVENAELTSREPNFERDRAGSFSRSAGLTHVDCHYLVTAIAAEQVDGPERDEHFILGAVLKVLVRTRVLPDALLHGSLARLGGPVRGRALRPGTAPSALELWQALRGKPRASLQYTVTIPVDFDAERVPVADPVTATNVGGA